VKDFIFSLHIRDDKAVQDTLELRSDSDGGLWLNDEPMTVMEARQFWAIIKFAMDQNRDTGSFQRKVEIALHDSGTMTACARGWFTEGAK
jgi:hypothetical protein